MDQFRKRYKVLSLFIMVLLACCIILIFTFHIMRLMDVYILQGQSSIRKEKELFVMDGVNNMVSDVDDARADVSDLYEKLSEETAVYLANYYSELPEHFLEFCYGYFEIPDSVERYDALIENTETGEIAYRSGPIPLRGEMSQLEWIADLKENLAYYHHRSYGPYEVYWGVDREFLEEEKLKKSYEMIRSISFTEDTLIWVDEILKREGGENYAIRQYDSTQPTKSSTFLSTTQLDAVGRSYYEAVLNNLNRSGSSLLEYNYVDTQKDRREEMLVYSKVYADYNWIISMGTKSITRSEFEELIYEKRMAIVKTLALQICLVLVVLLASAVIAQMLLEKWYYNRSGKTLKEQANSDVMTKIFNRRGGMTCLEQTFKKFKENADGSAIVMLDIDNFKTLNDTYGHEFGDKVLVQTVESIKRHIRSTDVFVRWGGEEFLLICFGLQPEYLQYFARKILDAVRYVEYQAEGDRLYVTVSMGIAFYEAEDVEFAQAVKRADFALYKAKENGKNQAAVCVGDEIFNCE